MYLQSDGKPCEESVELISEGNVNRVGGIKVCEWDDEGKRSKAYILYKICNQ